MLKLAATIYAIQGDGLASAIVDQRQSLENLLRSRSLPPREVQALRDAGFTSADLADLAVTIQMNADVLGRIDPVDQRKRIESTGPKTPLTKVLRIGAGGLLIGFDIGSQFIPMVNAVTAFELVTSVAGGIGLIADGVEDKPIPGNR